MEVKAIERGILHGDYVSSASDPMGQMGMVVDFDMTVDLLSQDGSILQDKPCRDLRRIRDFTVNDHVVLGFWVGTIRYVFDNVTVELEDGSVCEVMRATSLHLKPYRMLDIDSHVSYYPGQRVTATSSHVFKDSRWLSGLWKPNLLEGKVTKVTVGSVWIDWFASPVYGPEYGNPPDHEQSAKHLKLLSWFAPTNWQLGDWCLTPSSELSSSCTLDEELPKQNSHNSVKDKCVSAKDKILEDTESALEIIDLKQKLSVAWQDGTIEQGLDSTSLIRIDSLGDHEFLARQYVKKKDCDDSDDSVEKFGVIKSVDAKSQIAYVKWLIGIDDPSVLETVSVYELERHSVFEYHYGDVVFSMLPPERAYMVPSENTSAHDMSVEFSDFSWVGIITGLGDGDVEVTWANGKISTVGPEDLCIADVYDDESVSKASEDEVDSLCDVEGEESNIGEAFEVVELIETQRQLKLPNAPPLEDFTSAFKVFDIIRDPSDHFFLASQSQKNVVPKKWLKKVQQDWDILQNSLPGGIYVRVYEDQIGLLRVVIVGAYGTPYQDGLFVFDFFLPIGYPEDPPSVHYHSGGWKINPNLYEAGKVCLSLLNTWTGRGTEVWVPSTSTILQVLVSIQGLVLNSKPYFNEAGYDEQVGTSEGEKHSLAYNENTFLLNCKRMINLIQNPPKDFEELVIEHFRKRGPYILKACDAYMKGHLIGSLDKDASSSDNNTDSNSAGFKLLLSKVAPKLFSVLQGIGANCQEYEHLVSP